MTREEAIDIIKCLAWHTRPNEEDIEQAIKALEQELCEDAVSRAEVIKITKEMYLEVANMELDAKTISDCISCTASKCREVLERKLQALSPVTPQEPKPMVKIDLYSVIKQKYIERGVLDRIRARIELEKLGYPPSAEYYKAIKKCLQIINKYKAESEG